MISLKINGTDSLGTSWGSMEQRVRKVTVTKVKKFCVKESRFLRLQKKNNPKKHLIDVFSSYIMTAPQMQN